AAGTEVEDIPYSDIGTMRNNVALMLRRSGRQKAAEPCYVRALEIYEKQLGPDHPDVASVLNNLAVFYTNERRYTEAEKLHLRALTIREKLDPPPLADIAQSKCNLAVVYHSRGDYAKAAELYQSSLKTWEEVQEQPSKDYDIVNSNYADLLRYIGHVRKAHQLEVRARKRRLGSFNHRHSLFSHSNLLDLTLQVIRCTRIVRPAFARVAELADAYGSGPYGET